MRLAVFTSQFPGRVSTFFARDMRALLEAGVDLHIFPIYPVKETFWRCVPDCLGESVFPRSKVHPVDFGRVVRSVGQMPYQKYAIFCKDVARISLSAIRFGLEPFAKSVYTFGKAVAWSREFQNHFDHVLAYWGNYAATCAYLFNRMIDRPLPFSMFLHAGTDLYRTQVFLRQKLLYADNIIVVCEFNRNFIRDLYPDMFSAIEEKIHLHHLGLDLTEFPYEPGGRYATRVIAVGGLSRRKGFDYLLRAASQLSRAGFDLEVELIGDGQERKTLEVLAGRLGIAERVHFRGWLSPDQVREAMKKASVLIHPSSGLGDAVPTVIKEAIALGTPVIASDVAGIPELLDGGRCGVLVPSRNIEALVDAMAKMLTDTEKRRAYSVVARQYAEERFDMWRNGQQLADLLYSTKRQSGQNC